MARFLHAFSPKSGRRKRGTRSTDVGLTAMDQDNGFFGLIVGGIVALAAMIFIISGGDLGGKKTVEGDQDLPPIASTDR
jgi:hypothetical protein